MSGGLRLRTLGVIVIGVAFASGLAAMAAWFASSSAWQRHLTHSYVTGIALYEALRAGTPLPPGITAATLSEEAATLADRGDFTRLPDAPSPGYLTNVSIIGPGPDPMSGEVMTVGIVSDALRYTVSELVSDPAQSAAQKFGNVTRLLAAYCSEPVLYLRIGDRPWYRVDGTPVWGCAAAPADYRVAAVLGAVLALAALLSLVLDTSARFDRFARALRSRGRLGGPESYSTSGPAELRDMVTAVNGYLEREREQLRNRTLVLSGVSHDLGTPATRLKLRTALIEDPDLRARFETDIDRMTGMIESVLTYTRSEQSAEDPRQVSLTSLVEALVADYQDMDRPVQLRPVAPPVMTAGRSVFMSRAGKGLAPDLRRILVTARPVSLQRAVSNLIDNALKYGRRATLELRADADFATVIVEDRGSDMSVEDIEALLAPFQRGANSQSVDGFGLGLTIVSAVANQHGGRLYFEAGTGGLRACLEICRN